MPEIPRYSFDGRLAKGAVGSELSVGNAMAPGLQGVRLGQEIAGLGQQLQQSTNQASSAIQASNDRKKAFDEQRENEEAIRAANEATHRWTTERIDWNEKNSNSEDVAANWKAYSDQRIGEIEATLPNQKAVDRFRNQTIPDNQSQWSRNLQHGELVRLNNITQDAEVEARASSENYNKLMHLGKTEEAQETVIGSVDRIISASEELVGNRAPATSAKIKEDAIASFVDQAADQDPKFARELMAKYAPHISQRNRNILTNRIEAAEKSDDAVGVSIRQEKAITTIADAAKNRGTVPELPEDYYRGMSPQAVAKIKSGIAAVNMASPVAQAMKGKNPGYQARAMEGLRAEAEKTGDAINLTARAAYTIVAEHLAEDEKAIKADPLSWQIDNNDTLSRIAKQEQSAWDAAAKATGPIHKQILESNAREIRRQKLAMSDKLQGSPEPGATNPESYLNLTSGQKRYATAGEVKAYAPRIINGQAKEVDDTIKEYLSRFPEEFRYQAWDNLRTMAKENKTEIPEGYFVAAGVQNEIKRRLIVDSIRVAPDLKNPAGNAAGKVEKESEFVAGINAELTSIGFYEAFPVGDLGGDNQAYINATQDTIQKYAISLMKPREGGALSLKSAIKQAVKDVVGDNMAFPQVETQYIPINKFRDDWASGNPNPQPRTAEEIERIPNNLKMALYRLPTEFIRSEYLLGLKDVNLNRRGEPETEAAVQKVLVSAARWRVTPDGKGLTLHFRNAAMGNTFEVLDKNGKPLMVTFDAMEAEQVKNRISFQIQSMSVPSGTYNPTAKPNFTTVSRPKTPDDLTPTLVTTPKPVESNLPTDLMTGGISYFMRKRGYSYGPHPTLGYLYPTIFKDTEAGGFKYTQPTLGPEWVNQR